jgi:diguanylate cyclase (GGDEF)-like protein
MKTDDVDPQVQALIQRGEIDRALQVAGEALRHAHGERRGRALLALASASNAAGRFTDALRAALAADALFRDQADHASAGDALLRAAGALRGAGDHALAIELLERAEQQARADHNDAQLAQVLRQIGIASSLLGRHRHAMSCLAEAASLSERLAVPDQLNARLSLLNARNRYAEALPAGDPQRLSALEPLLAEWLALADDCERHGQRRLHAMALGNHAITLHQVGRDSEAAVALRRLLPEYEALGMQPNVGLCLAEEAHCLRALGRLDEARERYRAAVVVLDLAGALEDRCDALEGLSQTEERLGDTAAALAALKRVRELERRSTAEGAQAAVRHRELRLELARLTSQWAREATEDPLTGLGNRRALQAWLRDHLPAVEEGEPLSLVLLDLDHFKQVNDRHGHGIGDEVLKKVARLLGHGCRGRDRAVRYGGEEFVLALAGVSRDAAAEVAERLRQHVADQPWQGLSPNLHVTASFGVADATEAAEPQALLTLADQRLYAAKLGGRNRVVAG